MQVLKTMQSVTKCEECSTEDISIIDSRFTLDSTIRRRRVCNKCGCRFTTYEVRKEDLEALYSTKVELEEMKGFVEELKERLSNFETQQIEETSCGKNTEETLS